MTSTAQLTLWGCAARYLCGGLLHINGHLAKQSWAWETPAEYFFHLQEYVIFHMTKARQQTKCQTKFSLGTPAPPTAALDTYFHCNYEWQTTDWQCNAFFHIVPIVAVELHTCPTDLVGSWSAVSQEFQYFLSIFRFENVVPEEKDFLILPTTAREHRSSSDRFLSDLIPTLTT